MRSPWTAAVVLMHASEVVKWGHYVLSAGIYCKAAAAWRLLQLCWPNYSSSDACRVCRSRLWKDAFILKWVSLAVSLCFSPGSRRWRVTSSTTWSSWLWGERDERGTLWGAAATPPCVQETPLWSHRTEVTHNISLIALVFYYISDEDVMFSLVPVCFVCLFVCSSVGWQDRHISCWTDLTETIAGRRSNSSCTFFQKYLHCASNLWRAEYIFRSILNAIYMVCVMIPSSRRGRHLLCFAGKWSDDVIHKFFVLNQIILMSSEAYGGLNGWETKKNPLMSKTKSTMNLSVEILFVLVNCCTLKHRASETV